MMEREYEVFNPHNISLDRLTTIFGFNNGGEPGFLNGQLLATDGEFLGWHICSNEGFMYRDLGILKGSRPDRHEKFREHFPGGYKMDFAPASDKRIADAYALHCEKYGPKDKP